MKVNIRGVPKFSMEFSVRQARILMELSSNHYDTTCRKASACGGFVYGLNNFVSYAEDPNDPGPYTLDVHQADILCKILESGAYSMDEADRSASIEMLRSIQGSMVFATQLSEQWTGVYEHEESP